MFGSGFGRSLTETVRVHSYVKRARVIQRAASARGVSDVKDQVQQPVDTSLLDFLVCPLSKKPLRYEANTNELINDELGIAYSITNGIPNMIPQEARVLQKDGDTTSADSVVYWTIFTMFSLSVMVGLVPIVSLFGLFYSAAVDDHFPQGCTSGRSVCFYSLLLPLTIPVYVFFHLWSWMGIKLFRHN